MMPFHVKWIRQQHLRQLMCLTSASMEFSWKLLTLAKLLTMIMSVLLILTTSQKRTGADPPSLPCTSKPGTVEENVFTPTSEAGSFLPPQPGTDSTKPATTDARFSWTPHQALLPTPPKSCQEPMQPVTESTSEKKQLPSKQSPIGLASLKANTITSRQHPLSTRAETISRLPLKSSNRRLLDITMQ